MLRLVLPFAALAAVLVSIVLALLHSALARLNEQRALRHRMVAERIFDELEREIGSVLQHEAERPSQAYDAIATDPARWAPFIMGYYRRDPELTVLAETRLSPERAARLRELVGRAEPELVRERERLAAQPERPARGARRAAPPRPSLDEPRATGASSPDLLRLLNRSGELRERRLHDFASSFAVAHVAGALLAERTAPDSGRTEGLLLDVRALLAALQLRLLGAPQRHGVQLGLAPLSAASAGYRYAHALAAPLDAYTVELGLPRLDDADASSALYGFAVLFTTATVLGLLAIYRMLVVQIAFAERRNNFVSAVTHELRTPLTTIRMYGEMLRDGMVSDEATRREYYATITSEGERLTRLINNVMEHGRLRRGQRRAQLQRVEPRQLVQEVLDMMRPHLEREGFRLELQHSAGCAAAQLDADALKQILFNALDNARKYGRGTGEALIEVSCESGADTLELRVRDHGPGVPEAQLPQLFEPFYRGEAELTREHQGTGLGLSLVRDLVLLMHGKVTAYNRNPGLELRVVLPLRAANSPERQR